MHCFFITAPPAKLLTSTSSARTILASALLLVALYGYTIRWSRILEMVKAFLRTTLTALAQRFLAAQCLIRLRMQFRFCDQPKRSITVTSPASTRAPRAISLAFTWHADPPGPVDARFQTTSFEVVAQSA